MGMQPVQPRPSLPALMGEQPGNQLSRFRSHSDTRPAPASPSPSGSGDELGSYDDVERGEDGFLQSGPSLDDQADVTKVQQSEEVDQLALYEAQMGASNSHERNGGKLQLN